MKRMTIAGESSVESEQNEINERKRVRLTRSSANAERSEQTNSEHTPANEVRLNHLNEPPRIQTSTPIIVNGTSSTTDVSSEDRPTENLSSIHASSDIEVNSTLDNNVDSSMQNNLDSSMQGNVDLDLAVSVDDILTQDNVEANNQVLNDDNAIVETSESSATNSENLNISGVSQIEENSSEKINASTNGSRCDAEYFLSSRLKVSELEGHSDIILSIAADEDIILSASRDTTIKLWNLKTKKEEANFSGHSNAVNAVELLTPDQSIKLAEKIEYSNKKSMTNIAISGSSDCSIRLWSVPTGMEILSVYTYNGITCLGFYEAQSYVIIGTDGGKLEMWDMCSLKAIHSVLAHEDAISDLKVEDCYVYTVSSDGLVKVWLIDEDELQVVYTRRRKEVSENSEQLVPCQWKSVTSYNHKLYIGDNTSNVKILDWKEGKLRMLKNQIQLKGAIDAVCTKNNVLLSSSYDFNSGKGAINVWQLPSMTYICTMSGEVDRILNLAMTETNDGIVSVISGGTKLLVWEYDTSQPPAKQSHEPYFCCEKEELGEEFSTELGSNSPRNYPTYPVSYSYSWCSML